jgi:hypothetical protein
MRLTALILGVGAACAACCAVPLLAAGTAALAGVTGAAFGWSAAAMVAAGAAVLMGLRRRARAAKRCGCGPSDGETETKVLS